MLLRLAAYRVSRTLNECPVVPCFSSRHCDSSTSGERDLQPATVVPLDLSKSQETTRSLQDPEPDLLRFSIGPAITSASVFVAANQPQDPGGRRAAKFAQTRFPIQAQRSRIQDESFAARSTPAGYRCLAKLGQASLRFRAVRLP